MGRKLGRTLIIIYLVSTVLFCWNMYGEMDVEKQMSEGEKFKITATDLAVMCLTTTHPTMEIELADSRDNEKEYDDFEIETLEGA